MFLQGLTVLDVSETQGSSLSLSQVAARQEVRDLLKVLRNPVVDERIAALRVTTEPAEEEKSVEQSAAAPAEAAALAPDTPAPAVVSNAYTPAATILQEPALVQERPALLEAAS